MDDVATALGLTSRAAAGAAPGTGAAQVRAPRIGMYQPCGGGNMDEGWTRWVLEQYGFQSTTLHNADVRAGALKDKYDAIILPDQSPQAMIDGSTGDDDPAGVPRRDRRRRASTALKQFVAQRRHADHARRGVGLRDREVRRCRSANLKRGPDARPALRARHDPQGRGRYHAPDRLRHGRTRRTASTTTARSSRCVEGFASQTTTVVARYPNDRRRRVRLAARAKS